MRERDAFHAEVCINDEVAGKDFCWHDLADLGVDDLLPRICRVRHNEAKVKSELLDHLPLHRHDLADWKLVHDLLRVKDQLSANGPAGEHGGGELHFHFLIRGQVPVVALPEHRALISILHPYRFYAELALCDII